MKMYDIASRLADFLAVQVELDQSKIDTVRYGLELILGEIIKWFILLSVAAFFNILPGVLFGMFSMALFRLVSGGNHCQDYWRCLVFGAIAFWGGGILGVYAEFFLTYVFLQKAILSGSVVMVVMVLVWAPGEVVYRKIQLEERGPFKIMSLIFLAIWTFGTILFILPYSMSMAAAGFLSMMIQTISFTPPGYWIIDKFDILLSIIIGERRCSHA